MVKDQDDNNVYTESMKRRWQVPVAEEHLARNL